MEIRKKLNLTGGHSDTLGLINLKKYSTNNSNQSYRNKNQSKHKEDLHVKPSPGAFLKNTKRDEKQIMIEDNFLSKKKSKQGSGKKEMRSSKLRKHLFNQNPRRIKNKKITSLKGIYSHMGAKYTSTRDVNQQNYNYEKFQSYRGFPVNENKLRKLSDKNQDSGPIEFEKGNLDSREAMERFAEYIAEGGHDADKNSKEMKIKMQTFSAQVSPKLQKSKFTDQNK
jgi:hypothetical protein